MAKKDYRPPPRKEPGLLSFIVSGCVSLCAWLIVSLLISIVIEWIGIKLLWQEEGAYHSQRVLMSDQVYLNHQALNKSESLKEAIVEKTVKIVNWFTNDSWLQNVIKWARSTNEESSKLAMWANRFYTKYDKYIHASITVSQIFVVRLALIVFSLPAFLLTGLVGVVDGLVERDLRRWGGGRESSNIYNLSRKSIVPAFISACVIYISLPMSINPVLVILPFAVLFGLVTRITFERLKKYF